VIREECDNKCNLFKMSIFGYLISQIDLHRKALFYFGFCTCLRKLLFKYKRMLETMFQSQSLVTSFSSQHQQQQQRQQRHHHEVPLHRFRRNHVRLPDQRWCLLHKRRGQFGLKRKKILFINCSSFFEHLT
jgi:hypothetical protein